MYCKSMERDESITFHFIIFWAAAGHLLSSIQYLNPVNQGIITFPLAYQLITQATNPSCKMSTCNSDLFQKFI